MQHCFASTYFRVACSIVNFIYGTVIRYCYIKIASEVNIQHTWAKGQICILIVQLKKTYVAYPTKVSVQLTRQNTAYLLKSLYL